MADARIVSSAAGLKELNEPWRALLSRATCDAPAASPLWLRPACEAALREHALRILTVVEGEELIAVLPMHLAPQGSGPLRRQVMQLLDASAGGGRRRGAVLVARGHEQAVINALIALLDGELSDWDKLELSGMVTDGVMPALLLANAPALGVAELSMDGHERRCSLKDGAPPRPAGWEQDDGHALRRAADAAAARPLLDMLDGGLRAAALAALQDGAALWGLYAKERLSAAALVLTGASGDWYTAAAEVRAAAPRDADQALHVLLMEQALAAGASQYAVWCDAPPELFADQCPIRGLTVERKSALNTRNRLWNRLQNSLGPLLRR